MKKRIVAAIAGGVWLAAIGSAAVVTYAIHRPVVLGHATSSRAATARSHTELLEAAEDETTVDSLAMEMPGATIVGYLSTLPPALSTRLGVAEMQGADDLTIGPGVVTHTPED
jgi:hypothetical protein